MDNEKGSNSGKWNSGKWNSGNRNSGYRNSGSWNSGDRNSGDWNSGDRNSGNWNSGYRNSGDNNTGNMNSGNWNTGDMNSGNKNSGDSNTGDMNSGNWNSGYRNSGDSNSGYRNSGAFCTDDNPKIYLFDNPTDIYVKDWEKSEVRKLMLNIETKIWVNDSIMTQKEKEDNPSYKSTGGYLKCISLKDAWRNMWDNLSHEKRRLFFDLPNFDADKFKHITGIDVNQCEKVTISIEGKDLEISKESAEALKKALNEL